MLSVARPEASLVAPVVQSRWLTRKTRLRYVSIAVGLGKLQSRHLLQVAPSNRSSAQGNRRTHQTEFPQKQNPCTIIVNSIGDNLKIGSGSSDRRKLRSEVISRKLCAAGEFGQSWFSSVVGNHRAQLGVLLPTCHLRETNHFLAVAVHRGKPLLPFRT